MNENIAKNAELDAEIALDTAETSFTFGEPRSVSLDTAETSFTYGEPRSL
ncbi:hypothetical protein AB0L57_07595 [Nocardia sp. NPDC052254]